VKLLPRKKYLLLFLAGIAAFLAVAPFNIFPLSAIALALLFSFWLRAESPRKAAWAGFAYGLGLYGAGVSFVYVAMHDYGGMNSLLAIFITMLAAAYLALFAGLAGYAQAKLKTPRWMRLLLVMPALWMLSEWLRGTVFTGFPCMVAGYSQIASPLAGYAPVAGVYGVSLAVALSAALLAFLAACVPLQSPLALRDQFHKREWTALALLLALWIAGALLRTVEWTQPEGEPLKVSLLQGNIPQEMKFDPDNLVYTLETYRRLILQSDARLIVLPETALPMTRDQLPENYAAIVRDHARAQAGDILIGGFEREHGLFYNSVYTLGEAPSQSYRKNHLVPFGEFIPLRPALGWFVNEVLNIPMGDLARGGIGQAPLSVAGQKVAVNICYEDVFGEEIIRALPQATLLVNVTNDAWYGNSFAALQHNQIAQMRALETGRVMLRATNTGVTSVIDRDGRVLKMLPQHEEGTLTAEVQGYAGSTPYVRFGNALVLGLTGLMLAAGVIRGRAGRK
jgi:apolipoprotein N-acyltransferase